MIKLQRHLTTNPCSVAQWASVKVISGNQSSIADNNKVLKARRDFIVSTLRLQV